jgi:hypothetical protein
MTPLSTVSHSGIESRKTFPATWQGSIGAQHHGFDVAPHSTAVSCECLDPACNPCFGHSLCCLTPCHIMYVHVPQVQAQKHRVRHIALDALPHAVTLREYDQSSGYWISRARKC